MRLPSLPRRRNGARTDLWRVLVPIVCLVAGLGFAVSARTARGTDLRAPQVAGLSDLAQENSTRLAQDAKTLQRLQAQVAQTTEDVGRGNAAVRAQQDVLGPLVPFSGLLAVHGPGLRVVLDDAAKPETHPEVDPNELVVHQSDMEAVINALWRGGAEGIAVAGQRITAQSAVRCVGNTLLVNGRVFSPPFVIEAIGPTAAMQAELAASPGVQLYEQAAKFYGLGYTVTAETSVALPAYLGIIELLHAKAGR